MLPLENVKLMFPVSVKSVSLKEFLLRLKSKEGGSNHSICDSREVCCYEIISLFLRISSEITTRECCSCMVV